MKHTIMKFIHTGITALLITSLFSCGDHSANKSRKQAQLDSLKSLMATIQTEIIALEEELSAADSSLADKAKAVEVQPVVYTTFCSYIDVQGKVDAEENVSINAEMPGTVSKINVKVGDAVRSGQVLAELDAKALQQGLAELQNALELASNLYDKQKNLWDQKIGTEVQYLAAKNQKESLEKKMASLQEQLRMMKIVSPINGIVDAVDIKLGQATAPGFPAIRVVNMDKLAVKGEVAESYASKVKAGNEVLIVFPDMKDTVKARISYAAKVISPLNRTFTVTVDLDNPKEFHPNMVAVMKIIDHLNPKAIVVPVGNIQHSADGAFVYIANDGKAAKVPVIAGRAYNGYTEIVDGLKEGDDLISKGFQDLNDGEKIKF